MKNLLWCATAVIALSLTTAMHAQPQEAWIEVPIVFEFKEPTFRTEPIYRSVCPTLVIGKQSFERPRSKTENGRLEASFQVPESALGSQPEFHLKLGSRVLSVTPRPITWQTKENDSGGKPEREGRMSTVYLLDQPDPNWPVFQAARILVGPEKSSWMLEAIVDNKSNQPIALETIVVFAEHPGGKSTA